MEGGRNRCLTMHQPWASLLVHGIKRIEGRSWPAPLTGRLWIHAASKVPDDATIKAMEEFYREIYALDGITDLKFPQHYPVSRLIGCVDVVGCLRHQELANWKEVPEGVRLEALTDFCWLCERPQKLPAPIQMRGWQGVYDLESKTSDAAMASILPAESPLPLKFPLPNPQDPFSLKPGSISSFLLVPEVEKSPKLIAVIDAASRAATQFSNKGQNSKNNGFDTRNKRNFTRPESTQFKKDQHIQHYPSNGRNQRNFTRSSSAQFVMKEHDSRSYGFNSRYERTFNRPGTMWFVKKDRTNGRNSVGNQFNGQYHIEGNGCSGNDERYNGHR